MEKIFKCPKCGELSYENVIPAIGRHLLCPYCETKFNFEFKHLIGEGSQYGLSRRYSEAELAKLVSESLVVAKEEPAKEEPAKEEPTKEEPTKEEPAKEEAPAKTQEPEAVTVAVAETPKAETPSAPVAKEEPAKEDPAKEEPAKEEPTKEEAAKEEAPAKTQEPEAVTVAIAETPKAETPSAPVAKEELISKPVEKLELSQITINEQRLDCLKPTEIDPGQKLLAQSEIRDNSVLASSEIQPLDTAPSSKECKVPAQPIIEKIR